MNLEKQIIADIKEAMLSKNVVRLEVCRAIKAAILIEKTNKVGGILNEEKELQILQKLLKQRRESEKIYNDQFRSDLAKNEKDQADIIASYLPSQYSDIELENIIDNLIKELNISSKKDMGRLMSAIIKKVQGKADGKKIATIVQQKLIM
tara:strand:+ start:201 stop:650 length:450 start_codon:yes stop_codon:yes gene_type:complete